MVAHFCTPVNLYYNKVQSLPKNRRNAVKNWKKQALAASLSLTCLFSVLPALATGTGETMRIGLYYGDTALPAANLENSVGKGYYLGYSEGQGEFHSLAYTDVTQITMLKTQNMYFKNGAYSDTENGGTVVGCYHLQLGAGYGSFDEANALAARYEGGFPAWIDGSYAVRVGAYPTRADAQKAQDDLGLAEAAIVGTSSYGISVVATKTAQVLFQFDGGEGMPLTVRPGLEESVKAVTWFKGYRYYGDFRYERIKGGNLTVVSLVDSEDYINCVISQEMSESWPVEALKAQAVCARTYAEVQRGRHGDNHFDLCSSTHCQAYIGMSRTGPNTQAAAAQTAGIHAWYDGRLAQTYYFSSSGGATEDPRNVWNGNTEIPYLKGVVDPYETAIADTIQTAYGSRKYRWSITYTGEELAQMLRDKGYQCADIVDLRASEVSPTGNVVTLTFVDSEGKSYSFSREKYVRTWMGTPSVHYTISGSGQYYVNDAGAALNSVNGVYAIGGDGTMTQVGLTEMPHVITANGVEQLVPVAGDTFTLNGAGWGHNVGMSQWGAYAMANQGKTYDEILKFYFTGIELY